MPCVATPTSALINETKSLIRVLESKKPISQTGQANDRGLLVADGPTDHQDHVATRWIHRGMPGRYLGLHFGRRSAGSIQYLSHGWSFRLVKELTNLACSRAATGVLGSELRPRPTSAADFPKFTASWQPVTTGNSDEDDTPDSSACILNYYLHHHVGD